MAYANALVIQRNEMSFFAQTLQTMVVGETRQIPTNDADAEFMGSFWAIPIKDNGHFSGYNFKPKKLFVSAPTYDSFECMKLKDRTSGNFYTIALLASNWIAGTYTAVTIPVVIPERTTCLDANGTTYTYEFAMPFKTGGQGFFGYTAQNNVLGTTPITTASLAALVTWLNANATFGATCTWSADGTKLKLVTTSALPVGINIQVA